MFSIFIKPLDSDEGRFIFFGCFGSLDNIDDIVKECVYSPMKEDAIYKRSLIQIHPSKFFEVMVKNTNDDEEVFLKTFDAENCEFVEED